MLRGNLCLVARVFIRAGVFFQSDFLLAAGARHRAQCGSSLRPREASDKGPAKGPPPWRSLRTVTMSATWNSLRANKFAFELRKLRELLFGREAIYPRSAETCRWRSKGKGTRSERVEKCSLGPRREGDQTGGAALISDQKLLFRSAVTGGSFRLSIRGPEVLHCFCETKTGT